MDEWLNLLLRWVHITAGIAWIGSSFFFIWLENHLEKPAQEKDEKGERVLGQLWLVHGGGYYQMVKKQLAPGQLPATLHWIRWEAGFTWLSGVALLIVVFYFNQGVYLIDRTVADISFANAAAIGWGSLLLSWLFYDWIWASPLGRKRGIAIALSLVGLAAVTYLLTQYLSGRAAYIHVGAILGTCMVGNVFMRIIPGQRRMVQATEAGREPDLSQGWKAKERSVHNNYMTFPVLFIMISNHFPATYAHTYNWLILAVLSLVSVGVKHYMNLYDSMKGRILVIVAACLLLIGFLQAMHRLQSSAKPPEKLALESRSIDPENVGHVRGTVEFKGVPPKPEMLELPSTCAVETGQTRVPSNKVLVEDGKLRNAFVWISQGLEEYAFSVPEAAKEVVLDQRGCVYEPRVIGIQKGQTLKILNSDPLFHNVRTVSTVNATFNEIMPQKDMVLEKVFDREEIMINAKCDVHPWMASFVGVVRHPFFQVTGKDGGFSFTGLPAGTYTLSVWHEVFGRQDHVLDLEAGKSLAWGLEFR